jgi:hypothetical protein
MGCFRETPRDPADALVAPLPVEISASDAIGVGIPPLRMVSALVLWKRCSECSETPLPLSWSNGVYIVRLAVARMASPPSPPGRFAVLGGSSDVVSSGIGKPTAGIDRRRRGDPGRPRRRPRFLKGGRDTARRRFRRRSPTTFFGVGVGLGASGWQIEP